MVFSFKYLLKFYLTSFPLNEHKFELNNSGTMSILYKKKPKQNSISCRYKYMYISIINNRIKYDLKAELLKQPYQLDRLSFPEEMLLCRWPSLV